MSFDPGAKLDPSQVEDVRGSRIGGRGLAVGGGGIGLIITIAWILLGGSPSTGGALGNLVDQTIGGGDVGPASSALAEECRTGTDANIRDDCRIVGNVNSVQAYWTSAFAASGKRYVQATTRFFTDQISTGCGVATSTDGPFYCPNDTYVYIDLGFFDDLRSRFGAQGGPTAQAYVIAHEYGHHVQDLLGTLTSAPRSGGTTGTSVRLELQADCFAGTWANHAAATGFLLPLTDA
ncbi:MAG: neutral zinc metallopeptidase, partial [Chloroflexota bacterium]|nr:neutral zinc metallopeptidase [Chloroflexota bacterium]